MKKMSSSITKEIRELDLPKKDLEEPPSDNKFIAMIISPAIILLLIAIFVPIAIGIIISLRNSASTTGFFGTKFVLTNYFKVLIYGERDAQLFWQYTYQTIFFSVVSVIIEFVLGLAFALILNKKFKGRGLARAALLIPWAIPTVASATIFRYEIFSNPGNYGFINGLLGLFNLPQIEFYGASAPVLFKIPIAVPYSPYYGEIDITMTMITAIIGDVWKTTPFITLLILASLQIVGKDLYDAADIAGASGWQRFRYITWPLIKAGVGIALIFRMMQALRVYGAVVVWDEPSVNSMTVSAVNAFNNGEYGLSSAIAILLFALIILFAIFILIFTRRREKTGKGEQAEVGEIYEEEERYHVKDFIEKTDLGFQTKLKAPTEAKIKWYKRKRIIKRGLFYLAVIFMCLFCALPFIWIVLRSFRNPYLNLYPQDGFELIPKFFSIESYEILFETSRYTGASFDQALLNSLLISSITVGIVVVVASLIAYAIAKFEFRGKSIMNSFIFSMNSLPPLIIIIPFFIQINTITVFLPFLKLEDNLFTLALPYAAFNLPLAVFILVSFFREIPDELSKAAKVDGASNFQVFRKVILPLTVPGIFTTAILVFIYAWNELIFAQVFLISDANNTVPLAILRFVFNPLSLRAPWATNLVLMAATSLATVPLVIVVLIFQRKIVSGLTRGAVKG